jgi:hypothetical protein
MKNCTAFNTNEFGLHEFSLINIKKVTENIKYSIIFSGYILKTIQNSAVLKSWLVYLGNNDVCFGIKREE